MRSLMRWRAARWVLALAVAGCGSEGSPDEEAVRSTIGPAGGTVVSADGRFRLTVPAGVASGDVSVTVTRESSPVGGGVGSAYSLRSEGGALSGPVEVAIELDSADVAGLTPAGLVMGLGAANGDWFAALSSSADAAPALRGASAFAARGTVIRSGNVFIDGLGPGSRWEKFAVVAFWYVDPAVLVLKPGESKPVRILVCTDSLTVASGGDAPDGEDDLAPIVPRRSRPPAGCFPSVREGTWSVNGVEGGNRFAGTVAAGSPSSSATYTAPGEDPGFPIVVTADLRWRARNTSREFDVPVQLVEDTLPWSGRITWSLTGSRTESFPGGSRVSTRNGEGFVVFGAAPDGSAPPGPEGGTFFGEQVTLGFTERVVETRSSDGPGTCRTATRSISEVKAEVAALRPTIERPVFAGLLVNLRGDNTYDVNFSGGEVPAVLTETEEVTVQCPGQPDGPPVTSVRTSASQANFPSIPFTTLPLVDPNQRVFGDALTFPADAGDLIPTTYTIGWRFRRQ